MRERLEEIKREFEVKMNKLKSGKLVIFDLHPDDIKYLIQQAELVEKLSKINKWLEDGWDTEIKIRQISDERIGKLFEKNQRYKQTIDLIEEGYRGSGEDLEEILDKLFYGGTSPVRGDKDE